MKKLAVAVFGIVVLAGWSSLLFAAEPAVRIASKAGLGGYLVNEVGWTLYWYSKDSPGKSVCEGQCLEKRPVFFRKAVTVSAGLAADDFGTVTRRDGTNQTTFRGYPLYYWANDLAGGDTNGQGISDVWFVIDPAKFPPKPVE